MELHIRRDGEIPVYLQIRNQIRDQIVAGVLKAGYSLPPERRLAQQLGVNRTTVLRAYQELKADGLAGAHVGQGTRVLPQLFAPVAGEEQTVYPIQWGQFMNRNTGGAEQNLIRDVLAITARPDTLSLAAGLPEPGLFPTDVVADILGRLSPQEYGTALSHGPVEGLPELRRSILRLMEERDIRASLRELIVLSGSQQGLDYAARTFLEPGDIVVTEEPTYLGALNIFRALGARVVGVPVDKDGMRTDLLEGVLSRYRARMIYTLPTFQNPTGTVLSLDRRLELLSLAQRYMVPVLEDDPYGELRYEGASIPSLKALDHHGCVIYLSTFSKALFMGGRVGWAVAPRPVVERFAQLKQLSDLQANTLSQVLLDRLLREGHFNGHRQRVRDVYRKKRDLLSSALTHGEALGIRWHVPEGGFYIWCSLPATVRPEALMEAAARHGVAYLPGEPFFPAGESAGTHVRLSFSYPEEDKIQEAVKRFISAVEDALKAAGSQAEDCGVNRPMV